MGERKNQNGNKQTEHTRNTREQHELPQFSVNKRLRKEKKTDAVLFFITFFYQIENPKKV